jgi:hypothetical protein
LLSPPLSIYQLEWTPDGRYLGFLTSSPGYSSDTVDFLLEPAAGGAPLSIVQGVNGGTFDVRR